MTLAPGGNGSNTGVLGEVTGDKDLDLPLRLSGVGDRKSNGWASPVGVDGFTWSGSESEVKA